MSANAATSYEELPYDAKAFSLTHPDALAVVGALRGMSPPAVATCRILELGCANGGNLIPMAYSLPGSRCVGIDLSPRQVADGQAVIDDLGLKNISLRAMSILDVNSDFGEFDYIVCHGVFSWVPRIVQDKILEICRQNLAPNGIAYVSYNTYPGWHFRGMIREMMNFHVQTFETVKERVQHARAFLNLMAQIWNHQDPTSTMARCLKDEAEDLEKERDTYVFHEHLEENNEPLYFQEFNARAESAGLQYLWEAKGSALARSLPEAELRVLDSLSDDLIRQEQYFDFLRRRVFRKTMLCRKECSLTRVPNSLAIKNWFATSRAKPVCESPNLDSTDPVEFSSPEGITLTTNRPLMKRMLGSLFELWPQSVSVSDLWNAWQADAARFPVEWIEQESVRTIEDFSQELLTLFLSDTIELHSYASSFVSKVTERPVASALARHMAQHSPSVTNLRHQAIVLSDFERLVLFRLDGTRTVEGVLQSLLADVVEGRMNLEAHGTPVASPERSRELLSNALDSALFHFASQALLVDELGGVQGRE
jgi:methyltransferase-like protein/cyclopropane fatty-acyl-phospholipid synthase-like methyltransferase